MVLGLEAETVSNNFKFISAICLLKDILGWICRLSKFFQKDIIDIHQVDTMISATKDTISMHDNVIEPPSVQHLLDCIDELDSYQGIALSCSLGDRMALAKLRKSFVQNILAEFESRFPADDMKILKDLNVILNPTLLPESDRACLIMAYLKLSISLTSTGTCLTGKKSFFYAVQVLAEC